MVDTFKFQDYERNKQVNTKSTGWTMFQARAFLDNEPQLREILELIKEYRLTYPGELARELNMSPDTMKLHINLLVSKDFLVRWKVPKIPWHTLIGSRMNDLWAMGKRGRADFLKFSWVTLALKDQGGRWTVEEYRTFLDNGEID